jgi:hypothetical protein
MRKEYIARSAVGHKAGEKGWLYGLLLVEGATQAPEMEGR